jgi:hypothetical protein
MHENNPREVMLPLNPSLISSLKLKERKKAMKKQVLSILLTLCLGLTLLPALAFTISDKETIVTDPATGTIYFGKTEGGADALYRVVAKDSNTITLFYHGQNIASDSKQYHSSSYHQHLWSGSDICLWLNGGSFLGNASVFTAAERAAITAYGTTETTNYPWNHTINISQKIVLPSREEVQDGGTWNMNQLSRMIGSDWWLRSPGGTDGYAAYVSDIGHVYYAFEAQAHVCENKYVRPAFKLNLSSLLFTSSAADGKSDSASKNMGAVSAPSGAQKLTILDSILTLLTVEQTARTGNTLTLSYTGATAGKTLSAIVVNGTGAVTHYGKLAEGISDFGTADVRLPDSFDPNTMSLKVFVEQINANNITDYASNPVTVTIKEANTKKEKLIDSGVPGEGLEAAPGQEKEFNPNSKANENVGKKK